MVRALSVATLMDFNIQLIIRSVHGQTTRFGEIIVDFFPLSLRSFHDMGGLRCMGRFAVAVGGVDS